MRMHTPDSNAPSTGRRSSRARRRGPLGDRSGQTLALVALLSVPLVGMLGLAIDVGMLMTAHSEAQRAADAGALGGAGVFYEIDPDKHPVEAEAAAHDSAVVYATRNHIRNFQVLPEEVDVTVILDEDKVRVTVRREAIPTYFARVLGFGQVPISATAAAVLSEGGSGQCILPFFGPDLWDESTDPDRIPEPGEEWSFDENDTYEPVGESGEGTGYGSDWRNDQTGSSGTLQPYTTDIGRPVIIKTTSTGSNNNNGQEALGTMMSPGNFQLWRVPIPNSEGSCDDPDYTAGGDDIRDLLSGDQCSCPISLGEEQTFDTEPGQTWGGVKQGLDVRIAKDPDARWDEQGDSLISALGLGSPRVVPIALADPSLVVNLNGNSPLEFNNLAQIFIEGYNDKDKIVWARFMGFMPGGAGPTSGQLVKYLRLVE